MPSDDSILSFGLAEASWSAKSVSSKDLYLSVTGDVGRDTEVGKEVCVLKLPRNEANRPWTCNIPTTLQHCSSNPPASLCRHGFFSGIFCSICSIPILDYHAVLMQRSNSQLPGCSNESQSLVESLIEV